MNIHGRKEYLRKLMIEKRANLTMSAKAKYDKLICECLWKLIKERNYRTVHCYLPINTEINIYPVIEKLLDDKLTVVTPKALSGRKMENLVLRSLDEMEEGIFGTVYPKNAEEYKGEYELIITPGLAFDKYRHRLGYGGGYYDTFLVKYPAAQKIGLFYSFQEVDQLPVEAHDIALDELLTDKCF